MSWFSGANAEVVALKTKFEDHVKASLARLEAAEAKATNLEDAFAALKNAAAAEIADVKAQAAAAEQKAAQFQATLTTMSGGVLTAAKEIAVLRAALSTAGINVPSPITDELQKILQGAA